jgi:small GTP-binding protein
MEHALLTPRWATLLADLRAALRRAAEALARLDQGAEDRATLEASVAQLDRLFLLVVVGEFNAGKSSLLNALLGQDALAVGVTPTTARIHLVRHGPVLATREGEDGVVEVTVPAPALADLELVDTPGTNSLARAHEALTRRFVPRADLVLVVTSADRPFSESERAFLAAVREWGKKLVFVVNRIDILERREQVDEVVAWVRQAAVALLGEEPPVFALSARLALAAGEDAAARAASGLPALERHLATVLGEEERLRLKLANPLGVANRLLARDQAGLADRLGLLGDDLATFDEVERAIALYREDLGRQVKLRLADVEAMLAKVTERGRAFFDEHVRLGRLADLLARERLRDAFEQEVVGDLPNAVERKASEGIDALLAAELRQWQELDTRLAVRRAAHPTERLGALGRFDLDRERALEQAGRVTHRAIEGFDRRGQARRIADEMRAAVAGTALLEVGAVGLGTAVATLATSQLADVTGLLAAGTLAVLGLLVLPARRERAKRELERRVAALREKLLAGLGEAFGAEVLASGDRLAAAVAPSARTVRAERERLAALAGELAAAQAGLAAVGARLAERGR